VLGKESLFDLAHRTVRYTPEGAGYRVENAALKWDSDFGTELTASQATLKSFAFPFSGKNWNSFSVGTTGSIAFAEQAAGARGGRGGGLSIDRFAELAQAGRTLINTTPAISVFFKPRMSGTRYLKELDDRAVITWSLTEPLGGVQDMTWRPTVNRFQAVLFKNGVIEMSYDDVAAQDAIVGVYPLVTAGAEKELGRIVGVAAAGAAPHLSIRNVTLASVDGLFLKAAIETAGPLLPEGDAALSGITYRVCLNGKKPAGDCTLDAHADAVWTIQGGGGRGARGGGGATPRYFASGPGVAPQVNAAGNTLSLQGTLPAGFKAGDQIFVSAAAQPAGASRRRDQSLG